MNRPTVEDVTNHVQNCPHCKANEAFGLCPIGFNLIRLNSQPERAPKLEQPDLFEQPAAPLPKEIAERPIVHLYLSRHHAKTKM
jgi:hypothetical protein